MSVSKALEQAGVVGCGGAGFPTHVKLAGNVEYLIINGAECEPLLQTDRYIMRHCADAVVFSAASIGAELGVKKCVIALKAGYKEEIAALRAAISEVAARSGVPVSLHFLESFYPAGDEQTVVYEVTGRQVPPAGIPLDVGCAVSNAATMLAASDAIAGKPFTHKFLTVSGEVQVPKIVKAPLGTPLSECLAASGGPSVNEYRILAGGPMMGKILSEEDVRSACVTKTMSGIIVLPAFHRLVNIQRMSPRQIVVRARAACIRCAMCSELCPRHLLGHPIEPHKIMRRLALNGNIDALPLDDPVIRTAALCCECGICELLACPMELQPRQVNAALRKKLAASGARYEKGSGQRLPDPMRETRKIPTKRAAARTGVNKYEHVRIDCLAEIKPETVTLPLSQHIGAPCEPLIGEGEHVKAGGLIASPPKGKLGANLHASITGVATILSDAIVISSEGVQAR